MTKILAVSDELLRPIYSQRIVERYGDVDLVIGCGDLPYYYLEFIVTMIPIPVTYVFGNHDEQQVMSDGRIVTEPEGCISLEEETVCTNGLLLAGLGGSMRYRPKAKHQYSEMEMWTRLARLIPKLVLNHMHHGRYLDIFVAHSPPYKIHDGKDLAHRGFKSFLALMRWFKPRYMLHGHKHIYRQDTQRVTKYHETHVVNVYPARVFNWEEGLLDE